MIEKCKLKNSGVEWIGEVPERWNTIRQMDVSSEVKHPNAHMQETNLLSLSYGRIIRKDIKSVTGLLPESFEGYNIVEAGDVIIRLTDLQNDHHSIRVARSCERGIITSAYITLRPNSNIDKGYFYYTLLAFDIRKELYGMGGGVRQGLNYDQFKRMMIPVPTRSEQQSIALYLDEKIVAIDARIAVLSKKLAVYKRLKTSIINSAVTRGYNPTSKMKDSGVDWIDKVPVGWEVKNLTHLCQFFKGLAITKADLTETGTPVISYGQIHSKINTSAHLKPELLRYIPEALAAADPGARLKMGDIVFADTSEDVEGCGNCILMDAKFPVYAGYHAIVARPKDTGLSHYLSYLFNSPQWRSQIRSKVAGIKVFSVTQRIFKGVSVLLPSVTEANAIADYLDAECAKIDKMAALVTREIELYKNLKRSLINEVVTGKREVA